MAVRTGELTFLEVLAPRFKIPIPDFVVEPVRQSEVKQKLAAWGSGIVKPDVLAGKRGKAGTIRKVDDYRKAMQILKKVERAIDLPFLAFALGRVAGGAGEYLDHRDSGTAMDMRVPVSECQFLGRDQD